MSGISELAYIVAECSDIEKWRHYGEQILGMSAQEAPGGGLYLKMDERGYRILVIPGDSDCYHASGWAVADQAGFESACQALEGANVVLESADEELKALRKVRDLVIFTDPSGNRHELSWGDTGERAPFVSPIGVSGFKTGQYGLGHTVLPAPQFDETLALFSKTLGFGMSDECIVQPAPDAPEMRIFFMHCNGRHHSLALGEFPHPAGCIHIMMEAESMSEVGKAYDRMAAHDVKLMATLGEHTNDHMTSFYMQTPSNFPVEYGWGGKILDPETYETTHTSQISVWGHDFSVGFEE